MSEDIQEGDAALQAGADDHGLLTVTVYNEDTGGDPIIITRGHGVPVQNVIDEVYSKFNREPDPGDRLLCEATGEAVPPHAGEHLGVYAAQSCPELVWTFAGDTGGA